MTGLELTLIALCAILWIMGGHICYMWSVMGKQAKEGRLSHIACIIVWPFAVLWALASIA